MIKKTLIKMNEENIQMLNYTLTGIVLFLLAFWLKPISYERIDAGYTGIKFNYYGSDKGVSDTKVVSGIVWYNPWLSNVYEYPHHYQTIVFEDMTFNSSEGSILSSDIAIIYRLDQDTIPSIFDNYRLPQKELESTIIQQKVFDALGRFAGQYQAVQLCGVYKDSLLKMVLSEVNTTMNSEGFIFQQVSFARDITAPDNVKKSIDAVIEEQEQAKKAQARIITKEAEARQRVIDAEANAKARIAEARGDSLANVIKGAGIYEMNRKIAQSLTPTLLDYEQIQKWKGNVPYSTSGNNGMILNIK